jgi:hypothetical protein
MHLTRGQRDPAAAFPPSGTALAPLPATWSARCGHRNHPRTGSLRDLVTIQGNRLNVIINKVTGWAAIIAVPADYFGMNMPCPGFSGKAGG